MTKQLEADLHEQLEQQCRWSQMTPAQKKTELFRKQKELLNTFLTRHAISQAQYDEGMAVLMAKGA